MIKLTKVKEKVGIGNSNKQKKNGKKDSKTLAPTRKPEQDSKSIFSVDRLKRLMSPSGIDPRKLDHFELNDMGRRLFIRCFYVDEMPRKTTFAETFKEINGFSNAICSTFIKPYGEGKSGKQLDKHIIDLDSERHLAQKNDDINRDRKISKKMNAAESLAEEVEAGHNTLFEVGILISISAYSLDDLDKKTDQLMLNARKKRILLVACFGFHAQAYLLNAPLNNGVSNSALDFNKITLHVLDKYSLSTVFNHTRSHFQHEKGITLGRNLFTGHPITYDVYDPSHNGYGVVVTGTTHAGKSTTVKVMTLRFAEEGYVFASLDTESSGNRGEYSALADILGGVNYQISSKKNNTLNLFEISEENEYDEVLKKEIRTLKLNDKIEEIKHMLMTIVEATCEDVGIHKTFMLEIMTRAIKDLYASREIREAEPDSLYTFGKSIQNGVLTNGKVRKDLPVLTEWLVKVYEMRAKNRNSNKVLAYDLLISAFKDRVKELYICEDCGHVHTKEQFNESDKCTLCTSGIVEDLIGSKAYYDGQSTVKISTKAQFTNIDISQLPDTEKPIAQEIGLNFLNENFIKKNSLDKTKAQKMVVIFDETHKMFLYESARAFIVNVYRTARKRNVSPWTATQSLQDYFMYEETKAIVKNTTSKFLLRHDVSDGENLMDLAKLTKSQVDIISRMDKGEICLIDNNKAVFVKIDLLKSEEMVSNTDTNKIDELQEDILRSA